ncbi:MAG: protease modulator HflK [Bacteroidales bacterium]|nr:protease modulator HflK [Bacteroidales bacterium]
MLRLRSLLLAALILWFMTGIYQIRADERAVVRRFGAVVARPGPGLWIGWPWGIDRVDRIRVRTVRQLDVGYDPSAGDDAGFTPVGQLLTGDQNHVNLKLVVEYAIDERDGELDDYVANRLMVDELLRRETEAAMAEWVAGQTVDAVLLTSRAALPPWLMARLPERLAPLRLGLSLQRVSVDYLAAPTEVRDAFEAVNQAQTAIRTRINQAEQESTVRLREAEATRFRAQEQAEAYRREKHALAAADAESFQKRFEQYNRLRATNPHILTAIWWEEMGRTLLGLKSRGQIDLLDHHVGSNGLDLTQFLPPKGN